MPYASGGAAGELTRGKGRVPASSLGRVPDGGREGGSGEARLRTAVSGRGGDGEGVISFKRGDIASASHRTLSHVPPVIVSASLNINS